MRTGAGSFSPHDLVKWSSGRGGRGEEACGRIGRWATLQVNTHLRLASTADIPVLQTLIDASVRGLQAQDYTPAQIEGALKTVFGVDSQLIADGTYIVAEAEPNSIERTEAKKSQFECMIVGCGGWSKRKTLYGSDHWTGREDALLNPLRDA